MKKRGNRRMKRENRGMKKRGNRRKYGRKRAKYAVLAVARKAAQGCLVFRAHTNCQIVVFWALCSTAVLAGSSETSSLPISIIYSLSETATKRAKPVISPCVRAVQNSSKR